jgi:hypothetical protein
MATEWQKENARKGKEFEKKQDERIMKPVREAGETAVKGMTEGRMDAMGNAYKKGGKIMKHHHEHVASHLKEHDGGMSAKHHHEEMSKHSGGFKHHHEHVQAMCGGGMAKGGMTHGDTCMPTHGRHDK